MNQQGEFEQLLSRVLDARVSAAALSELGGRPIASAAEARALCEAARALAEISRSGELAHSGLHYLIALFQQVETPDAFAVFQERGIPFLYGEFDARLEAPDRDGDQNRDGSGFLSDQNRDGSDLLFMLKIFGLYRTSEGIDRIVRAVRRGLATDSALWPLIFGTIDEQHPFHRRWLDALRDPLPAGAIGLLYLDLCNDHATKDERFDHPFDNPSGMAMLQGWLAQPGRKPALSVMNALPFISETRRLTLLPRAMEHSELLVQMVGASAAAGAGIEAGVEFLAACCLNPNRSGVAMSFLKALGREDVIPDRAMEPDFQAMGRMCEWLGHPREYGRPPEEIELADTRMLDWPPSHERRKVWLFKYRYSARPGEKRPPAGVGMVGSITCVLYGETSGEMGAEEVYAMHAGWELRERAGDGSS